MRGGDSRRPWVDVTMRVRGLEGMFSVTGSLFCTEGIGSAGGTGKRAGGASRRKVDLLEDYDREGLQKREKCKGKGYRN